MPLKVVSNPVTFAVVILGILATGTVPLVIWLPAIAIGANVAETLPPTWSNAVTVLLVAGAFVSVSVKPAIKPAAVSAGSAPTSPAVISIAAVFNA